MTTQETRSMTINQLLDANTAIGNELSQPGMFRWPNEERTRELIRDRKMVRDELEFRHSVENSGPLPKNTESQFKSPI